MISEKYRGLLIEARANELQYDIGWSPILIIEKHDGNGVSATEIPIRGIYPTRAAAMNAALGQGRKEIDGAFWEPKEVNQRCAYLARMWRPDPIEFQGCGG